MNILYVINSGNPGGLEQYTLDLVTSMAKRGHNVSVWCASGEIAKWYEDFGATVTQTKISFELDIFYIFQMYKYIKAHKIDVVHTGELKAGINGIIAASIAGVNVKVCHIHTPMSEWPVKNVLTKIYRKLEIFMYSFFINNYATYEIALTESRKQIKIFEGIKPSKIAVVPNALDLTRLDMTNEEKIKNRSELCERYNIPPDAFILGLSSRLSEEKGHKVLLSAFSEFLHTGSLSKNNIYLFLAGGGALEEDLKIMAKELGITNRLRISGVFSKEDWAKFYCLYDLFVFPSFAEGFGLVLIEGMYMGIPVISSDIQVLREVSQNTITYFRVGNSHDLAEKVFDAYTNFKPDLKWSDTAAKKLVKARYSMDKFVQNYERIYEGTINR